MDDLLEDICICENDNVENEQPVTTTTTITKTLTSTVQMQKKKKGVFRKEWLSMKEYSKWLQEVKTDSTQARCKACLKTFSVRCDGKTALDKHMNRDAHKTSMKTFEKSTLITTLTIPASESDKISAAEGVLVYHGVKHGHSYVSQECGTNLVKTLFESSSSVAKSLSCDKTKSRAIACNVFGPYFTKKIVDEVLEARFYSLSYDSSNKGNCKTYPFTVQFFSDVGVKRALIQLIEDPYETAEDIFQNACKVINDFQLKIENLTSVGADNTNVNFGEHHSVFQLFKNEVPHIVQGNCYAHILHNAAKHAHDVLPIDIESVLCKIYSHFSRSAKRIEELKAYYEFVQSEYSTLLQHILTRWLSLLRSVERLLEKYEPIKLYFLNQPTTIKNEQLLKSFFDSTDGLCILNFLQNLLNEIQRADLQLQRTYTTAVDLHRIISGLVKKLQQRLHDKYFGNSTHEILKQLQEIDANKAEELKQSFESFIKTVIEYIKSYYDDDTRQFYEKLSFFSYQSLEFLAWERLMDVADLIKVNDLNKDELYSEYCEIRVLYDNLIKTDIKLSDQIKSYISSKKDYVPISTVNDNSDSLYDNNDEEVELVHKNQKKDEYVRSDHFWSYLLNINPNSTPNMKKIICYIFSIPCTNAYVETIFSHMKHAWSDYRNRMDIELVDAELKIRMNSDYPCAYMYKYLLSQPDILNKIRTNEKYQQKKRRNIE
ncbi:unnamed protein product [Rotaria sordida]|uniref:HAT C-terminal dimerisation domain-containing protein n=3 Tax=Rotaria sordida TaxID=392033 RepID=A0A819DYS6_9BILA|nr:unnamed protein product [Rotaria sordida]CAF1065185.1 unnamed protein product [Rotaria sordida]CAF1241553.1 unnamed protein product [Rotaria sordida]CAF3841418.1 unnamed protein product [Rotaria sordida]CAF3970103.1 unnamed protein product [Rotaria sordida]